MTAYDQTISECDCDVDCFFDRQMTLWSVIFQDVNHEDFELSFRYQFLAPPVDNLPPELQGPYLHPLDDQVKGTVVWDGFYDDSMVGKLTLQDYFKLVEKCPRYKGGFIHLSCKELRNLPLLPQSPKSEHVKCVYSILTTKYLYM
jgi:hypothetical protein